MKKLEKISSGCQCFDVAMNGGLSPEKLTLIYGEPETGKTTLALQFAVNCALQGFKTLFIDCENTFSTQRLQHISQDKFDLVADQIILIRPKDFNEQAYVVDRAKDYVQKGFGLIVFDTLTSLYGAKVSETEKKAFGLNRELNRQLAIIAETAKTRKISVLFTSQVRSVLSDTNHSVRPVATRVLKFWADTIIALNPTEFPQTFRAVFEKSRENLEEKTCWVQIGEAGINDSQFHQ